VKLPDQTQVLAFSRHVVSYSAGIVTAISAAHLWQYPTDAAAATAAIDQVGHGFADIVAGVATLASLGMGVMAAVKASPIVQMLVGAAALLKGRADPKKLSTQDQTTIMEATGTLPKVAAVVTNDPNVAAATSPVVVATSQVVLPKP